MSLLTCNQFLDELSEYLDEASKGPVREELQEHISECPNCWVMVDTTQKTLKIYRGMDPEPLPDSLRDRLMSALEKKIAGQAGG